MCPGLAELCEFPVMHVPRVLFDRVRPLVVVPDPSQGPSGARCVSFRLRVGGSGIVGWRILGVVGRRLLITRRPWGDDDDPFLAVRRPFLNAVESLL